MLSVYHLSFNVLPYICTRGISTLALPFTISRHEANSKFLKSRRFFELSDNQNGLQLYKGDPIREVYLPFYTAKVEGLKTTFEAKYGIDTVVKEWKYNRETKKFELKSRVITDWFKICNDMDTINYSLGNTHTQIYGDYKYSRDIIEKILPRSFTSRITPMDIKAEQLDNHTMKECEAYNRISAKIHDEERKRVKKYIKKTKGANHVKIKNLMVHFPQSKVKIYKYHLPAFIYETSIDDLTSFKVINGNTGELSGNYLLSPTKCSLVVIIPVVVMSTLFPIGIGYSFLAIGASGTLSYYFSKWWNKTNRLESTQQTEMNIPTPIYNGSLPIDKCSILEINPNVKITYKDLTTAYHRQLLKWHPDKYPGSKEEAIKRTLMINNAYVEICEILGY